MVLTVSFVLSPVIGLFCHHHRRKYFPPTTRRRRGVRATRRRRPRQYDSSSAPPASTASRLTSVTIAKRPSEGRDRIAIVLSLPGRQAKFRKFRNWSGIRAKCGPITGYRFLKRLRASLASQVAQDVATTAINGDLAIARRVSRRIA